MITEFFLSRLFDVAHFFLGMLPEIEWTVDTTAWEYTRDALSIICWLLPMGTIRAVIGCIIAIAIFRIVVSFIRFVISFVPFVGK